MLENPSASVQSEPFGSEICALSFLFRIETTVLAEPAGRGGERDAAQQKSKRRLTDSLSANVLPFVPNTHPHMFAGMFPSQPFLLLAFRAGMKRRGAEGSCGHSTPGSVS